MIEKKYGRLNARGFSETLPNGLRIFYYPKTGYSKTFAMMAVNYGAIDTDFILEGKPYHSPLGIAHYLEHKMFEEPDGNALQKFAETGATPNAYTSYGVTAYHFSCTDQFERNLNILLSYVFTPYFTEENVSKERGIIGQEISMMNDTPAWQAMVQMYQGLYAAHPIRHSIAGSIKSIAEITPQTLLDCYRAFYHPSNMALIVVGSADFPAICDLARMYSPPDTPMAERIYGVETPLAIQPEISHPMAVSIPTFMLGIKDKPLPPSPQYLQQSVIGDIAARIVCGKSSPLYAKLYEERLINDSFDVEYSMFPQVSCAVFSGQSHDPQAVQNAIQEEIQTLAHHGVPEAAFERVKRAAYGMAVRALDTPEEFARMQMTACFADDRALTFPHRYDDVSMSDITSMLLRWAEPNRFCLSVITPDTNKNEEK